MLLWNRWLLIVARTAALFMAKLKMKCSACGRWNSVPVDKIFVEQPTSEPKVKAYIVMYEPLQVVKCKKCGKIIAETKELIRIRKGQEKSLSAH
jgi:phage FluMu protein Com